MYVHTALSGEDMATRISQNGLKNLTKKKRMAVG